jgi:hypothetical protein
LLVDLTLDLAKAGSDASYVMSPEEERVFDDGIRDIEAG